MDAIFPGLTPEEDKKLLDAVPLITLLIGAADGNFDITEADSAQRLAKIRSYTYDRDLQHYYKELSNVFEERLNYFQRHMPAKWEDAKVYLSDQIQELDPLLQKMEGEDAFLLYQDLLSFAKHIANSSGGVFHMANISPQEKALLNLDMLTPINTYPGI